MTTPTPPSKPRTTLFSRFTHVMWELLRHKDPPHKVALGLALGIFIGFLPIMGIQMAVVTVFALPLRGNLKAAVAGVWISNPITFIPLYWANYRFGLLFYPQREVSWEQFGGHLMQASNWDWGAIGESVDSLLSLGADVFLPLWVGSAILGVGFGLLTYLTTYRWVVFYRKQRS